MLVNASNTADIRQATLFTKEARDYFAKDGVKGMKALAVLTGNPLTVIIANLFMTFSKPKVPTRAFKTKEYAMKWLRQFVTDQTGDVSTNQSGLNLN